MTEPAARLRPELAGFAVRMSLFYAASFLVIGLYLPYFPVWLDWRGLTAAQIGLVVALPSFARVIGTPIAGYLADRMGDPRRMVQLLALYTLACFLLLPVATTAAPIMILIALYGLAGPALVPLSEVVALKGVRAGGLDYGRMRLWGSVTFILANFAGGMALRAFGPQAIQWLIIAAMALTLAAAFVLPRAPAGPTSQVVRPNLTDATGLMGNRSFLVFLGATALVQSSHALLYAFGTLHWRAGGISEWAIGLLWAIGVIAEIVVFAYARRPLALLGPVGLLVLGAAAAAARWAAMALDPPLAALAVLQALHGLSFGAAHLGAIHYLSENVPPRLAATAQGLYSTCNVGIAMGGVLLVSGPLYASLGALAFWVMAALAVAGLAGMLMSLRR